MYLQDTEQVIESLIGDLSFWPSWAKPFVEANGKCVYCDEDLLTNRGAYAGAATDHLFPKARHPELEDVPENWFLSCAACKSPEQQVECDPGIDLCACLKLNIWQLYAVGRELGRGPHG